MQNSPFLSIITRTCKRPNLLKKCVESVTGQTDKDFEHLFIVDNEGRGKVWAQASLSGYKDQLGIKGKYVMVLDDDDYIADHTFIEYIKNFIQLVDRDPEIIFFKGNIGGRILPPEKFWGKAPVHAQIGSFCFLVKKELYLKQIHKWAQKDSGDFHFIRACFNSAKTVSWIDKVFVKTQKISRGVPGE
jgi:glycosyltransferase involved in cell wall biosynthesis